MPTLNKSEGKLFLAIQDRSVERVYKSLKSGVNPNCLHADGWSPAAEAAYNGTNVILIMLFEAGANINIITNGHALWNVASIAGHRSTERVVFAMRDLKERPEGYLDVIEDVRAQGDSVGGLITCRIRGVPSGLGEPVFDTLEGDIAKALFAIPAVKGVEFGTGLGGAWAAILPPFLVVNAVDNEWAEDQIPSAVVAANITCQSSILGLTVMIEVEEFGG